MNGNTLGINYSIPGLPWFELEYMSRQFEEQLDELKNRMFMGSLVEHASWLWI